VDKLRFHWPLALIAAIALPLLLTHLGSDYMWLDEGDTAVLASNILKFGVPKAWDGVNFFDSDMGARDNDELVMVSHPWLQYYVTAASFALFGENNIAARLPFALAGWLTIIVAYLAVYDVTRNRWAGLCSATLLSLSVQFLLFCRQCRYYSISMLLGTLLIWVFFRMKSAATCTLFTIAAILLFHSQPFGIVLVASLGLTAFIYPGFIAQRRWVLIAGPVIAVGTLPWIALAYRGYGQNSKVVQSVMQFLGRLVQYAIEFASVTPLIGIVVLGLIYGWWAVLRRRGESTSLEVSQEVMTQDELGFLLFGLVTLVLYEIAVSTSESTDDLWHIGIRHTTAVVPIAAMLAGMLIVKVSSGRAGIWLPLLLIAVFTRFAQLTPWIFWGHKVTTFDGHEVVEAHLPRNFSDRYLNAGQQLMFLRDLWHQNPGTVANVCEFLRQHANPGDVLITNYDWEPIYFYTHLRQALKILPHYPIYEAARRKGLPNSLFNVDHARWIVWRPIWEGYVEYYGEDLEKEILSKGGRATKVAEFEDTIWENRPEIHLHRFSGNKYFFTAPENILPAQIFRVDWPDSQ
jgi:4-amino-4-deoxy-L-arabinose transferase-like glycosyltransferase